MSLNSESTHTLKKLLESMVKLGGSDLFITVNKPPSYRSKNNDILPLSRGIIQPIHAEKICTECMPSKIRIEFAETQEANFSLEFEDVGRFRINVLKQKGNYAMVARHIKSKIPTIDELGLPTVLKDIIMEKRGLVIMVGATGSGKSTTLAAMINHRNENVKGHIITIEDPIEFIHEHKAGIVTQREVGTDSNDFKSALKNTLRQNPDVVLIGEIRDRDTMEFALELAQTGHLCLATLHANNASMAIERILHLFRSEERESIRSNIGLNLRAIISQRLIRTLDNKRTPAIEILVNTPRISDLIMSGNMSEVREAMEKGKQYGMITFDQSLFDLWKRGIISKEEALGNADSSNAVRILIQKQEIIKVENRDDNKKGKNIDQLFSSDFELEKTHSGE
ncbi:MAG: PilT/PilU family type 4a pilus ATPase [Methanobacteriota archaeon]|nr:MAG: PilT/PilU family type 4a pilus ATPase [Euryarchaeota archaeon]